MRVLWFSLTPSNYRGCKGLGYNGGGWIASLETEIVKQKKIELGVAFFSGVCLKKVQVEDVCYYMMPHPRKSIKSKINFFTNYDVETEVSPYLSTFKNVVEDFKPDLIQIFGSESVLGFVKMVTQIPCVLHLQGIINPYLNAFYPPSFSVNSFLFRSLNPLKILSAYKKHVTWINNALRERYLLGKIENYIGRTEWDKTISLEFNSKASYFYGSEILRESFYKNSIRKFPKKMIIVSTLSGVEYKGLDLVLKTAKVLTDLLKADFLWVVYGSIQNVDFFEKHTKIKAKAVNVDFRGVGKESDIYDALCNATAFAQTSYIDNSPNAVCEAQIVGCPVVATNVGGVSSLIENGISGFLVPANDPYMMAWKLMQLYKDEDLNKKIGCRGQEVAKQRHDKVNIVNGLLSIYNEILNRRNDKDERRS